MKCDSVPRVLLGAVISGSKKAASRERAKTGIVGACTQLLFKPEVTVLYHHGRPQRCREEQA